MSGIRYLIAAAKCPVRHKHAMPVLVVLAEHADDSGCCFPSVDLIVELTGISKSSVLRAITRLEDAGVLISTRRRGARNDYRLALDVMERLAGSVHETPGGVREAPGGVTPTPVSEGHRCHPDTRVVSHRHRVVSGGHLSSVTLTPEQPKKNPRTAQEEPTAPPDGVAAPVADFELDGDRTTPSPPKLRAASKPRGPHAEFTRWFAVEYENRLRTPYMHSGAKDGTAVSRLLKRFDIETLKLRASRMLASTDPWLAGTARDLAILASQINRPELVKGSLASPKSNGSAYVPADDTSHDSPENRAFLDTLPSSFLRPRRKAQGDHDDS